MPICFTGKNIPYSRIDTLIRNRNIAMKNGKQFNPINCFTWWFICCYFTGHIDIAWQSLSCLNWWLIMTYLFLSICLTKRNTVVIMIHLYFVSQAMWEQFNWFMPIQLLIILAASVPREDLLKKLLPIRSFWKCKLRSTSEPCLVLLVSIPLDASFLEVWFI